METYTAFLSDTLSQMIPLIHPPSPPLVGIWHYGCPNELAEVAGSGTIIRLAGLPFILTCEHVVDPRLRRPQPGPAYSKVVCTAEAPSQDAFEYEARHRSRDLDLAFGQIAPAVIQAGCRDALDPALLSTEFSIADGEPLVVSGWPKGVPIAGLHAYPRWFATTIAPLPARVDADLDFALEYPAAGWRTIEGEPTEFADPPGYSGAAVWATRRTMGQSWSPNDARVVGVLYGHHRDSRVLLATRIDKVREFVLKAIRRELAYALWRDRGSPAADDWTDWLAAVGQFPDLR